MALRPRTATRRTTVSPGYHPLPMLELPKERWLPPLQYVQIATHSRCNADCVFCPYIESVHHKHPGMMTDETWNLILDNLVPFSAGLKKICPYLMQEPLLDKSIYAKIGEIYERFPHVSVEISTNGAALTEQAVEKLFAVMDGRKHDIWVSHHGVNKETFEHIMQIDYQRSTDNLMRMLKMSNGRFTIKIRGAGKSKAVDKTFFTRDEYLAYWERAFTEHEINRTNVSVDAFEFHDRAGSLMRTDRDANQLNQGIVRQIGPGRRPFSCSRINEWVHFMHDGRIRICCMDYHHEVQLPSIHEMSLLDYYHSEAYISLVNCVSGRTESPANFICKRCTSPGG